MVMIKLECDKAFFVVYTISFDDTFITIFFSKTEERENKGKQSEFRDNDYFFKRKRNN